MILFDDLFADDLFYQFQILRKESQEPVETAIPSSVTPRQLTRLSWPARTPAIWNEDRVKILLKNRVNDIVKVMGKVIVKIMVNDNVKVMDKVMVKTC